MKKSIQLVKKRLEKIRQLMSKAYSPDRGKSKQEVINKIRKMREKMWEKNLAAHSR